MRTERVGDAGVTAVFAGGSRVQRSAGCGGRHAFLVRAQLVPGPAGYAGYVAWRGIVDSGHSARDPRRNFRRYVLPAGRNDAVYPVPRARRRHAADTALQFRVVPARPMSMSCCRNCAPTPRAAARPLDPAAADQTRIHRGLAARNAGAADRGNRRAHCGPFFHAICDIESPRLTRAGSTPQRRRLCPRPPSAWASPSRLRRAMPDRCDHAGRRKYRRGTRATNASGPVRHPHRRAGAAWAPISGRLKPRAERGSGLRSGPKWCCEIGSPLVDIRGLESAPIMTSTVAG